MIHELDRIAVLLANRTHGPWNSEIVSWINLCTIIHDNFLTKFANKIKILKTFLSFQADVMSKFFIQ